MNTKQIVVKPMGGIFSLKLDIIENFYHQKNHLKSGYILDCFIKS